jgi:hypothetical protein
MSRQNLLFLALIVVGVGFFVFADYFKSKSVTNPTHVALPDQQAVAKQTTVWETSKKVDDMDHSTTFDLQQQSSTSEALLVVRCSNLNGRKLTGRSHFQEIFFFGTGPIMYLYSGMNGGKEQVRYKYEDDIVHAPFWFTGSSHDSFIVKGSSFLKEMLKHKNISIEFSPEATVDKFDLQGLPEGLDRMQCNVGN